MLIQRAFLPTMADDMLGVAQQIFGPLQWYSKSKTEKKTYSHIRNMSVQDLCSHAQCFYGNFSFILPQHVQTVTSAPSERYVMNEVTWKYNFFCCVLFKC